MLLQAGYETGLNMLDNSFKLLHARCKHTGMCLIGINLKKKKRHYSFLRHHNYRKETFLLNTNLQLKEMEESLNYRKSLLLMQRLFPYGICQISWCATTKWRNYFLWVFGWIDKFIRIKTNQKLHEIQLLLAKANYNVIKEIKLSRNRNR
jgi:hypothetical protein